MIEPHRFEPFNCYCIQDGLEHVLKSFMDDGLEGTGGVENSWDAMRQAQMWIKMGIFFVETKAKRETMAYFRIS